MYHETIRRIMKELCWSSVTGQQSCRFISCNTDIDPVFILSTLIVEYIVYVEVATQGA